MSSPYRFRIVASYVFFFFLSAALAIPAVRVDACPDSPDGDPVVQRFEFPASKYPLSKGHAPIPRTEGRAKIPALPNLPADFVMTGSLPEGDSPTSAAFSLDGTKIIIAHRDSRNLILFDAATRDFLMEISLSGSPNDVAVSSDGVHAVTANLFEDTASIVDLSAGQEIAALSIGDQPGVVRITPDGTTAIVGCTVEGSLSIIDIPSLQEIQRILGAGFVSTVSFAVETGAWSASFSDFAMADDNTIVHPDYYNHEIKIFDIPTASATVLSSQNYPRGVAVTPNGALAAVTHTSSVQQISVVDVPLKTITKTISCGTNLNGPIALRPDGVKAVVAVSNACRYVDLATGSVSGNINTASVYRLLTTNDGLYALCVGYNGSLIDFTTGALVKHLNSIVSTPIGAVSPTGPRAVLVANTFGEDMVVVSTNGPAGHLEGTAPSGPKPEGDKARTLAVHPQAGKAVVVNIFSDNASIVNLHDREKEAIVDLGDRPAEVEITPDGSKAVVANLDSTFASVIDLSSQIVTNVGISWRGSQVEISPDGKYAYVAVVASGDGVWKIDLDTLATAGGKLSTGNMGSVGYSYWQSSGLTLSHDGATLVTCNSFDDTVSIVDTAAWSVMKTLTVGDFPTRAVFAEDDSRIYVANRDGNNITVATNQGSGSAVIQTINVGKYPFEMVLDSSGQKLYVLNFSDKKVGYVDLNTGLMTNTVSLPQSPVGIAMDKAGLNLYVSTGTSSVTIGPGPKVSFSQNGQFSVINIAAKSIILQKETGLSPSMQAFESGLAGIASPPGDGLVLIEPIGVYKY